MDAPPAVDADSVRPAAATARPLLVVLTCVAATFASVPGHQFVTWDDDLHVTANPHLGKPVGAALAHFWSAPYGGLYIPVSYTVFAAESALSRLVAGVTADPRVFHSVSLALHLVGVALAYRLLLVFADPVSAAFGALLFGLHPLQVESVAWVSETRGLLATAFTFGAVLLALPQGAGRTTFGSSGAPLADLTVAPSTGSQPKRGSDNMSGDGKRFLLGTVLLILALLSKPSAVITPLWLLILELALATRPAASVARRVAGWIAIAAVAAILTRTEQAALRIPDVPLPSRTIVALDAIGFYLRKLAAPVGLCIDYGRTPQVVLSGGFPLAGLITCAALAAFALTPGSTRRPRAAAVALFLAALAPVLGLIPFAFQYYSTVADRYASAALFGPALAVAALYDGRVGRSVGRGRLRIATLVVGSLVGVAWTTLGWRQTTTWRDNDALYTHTLRVNADSFVSWNNRGNDLAKAGLTDEAIVCFEKSLAIRPDFSVAHRNLGLALLRTGRADAGIDRLRAATRSAPDDALTWYDLATALWNAGDRAAARAAYASAVRANPKFAEALNGLGNAATADGDLEEAARQYRAAVAADPRFVAARINLANALLARGDPQQAAAQYEAALRIDPNQADAWHNLGAIAADRKQWAAAESHLRRALTLSPGNVRSMLQLATVLEQTARPNDARALYDQAVAIEPKSVEACHRFGRLLLRRALGIDDPRVILDPWAVSDVRSRDDLAAAREQLEEAGRVDPARSDARLDLGTALLADGDVDGAIREFAEAARIERDSPWALYHLAGAHAAAERVDEAIEALEAAERRALPGSPASQMIQERLEALRSK